MAEVVELGQLDLFLQSRRRFTSHPKDLFTSQDGFGQSQMFIHQNSARPSSELKMPFEMRQNILKIATISPVGPTQPRPSQRQQQAQRQHHPWTCRLLITSPLAPDSEPTRSVVLAGHAMFLHSPSLLRLRPVGSVLPSHINSLVFAKERKRQLRILGHRLDSCRHHRPSSVNHLSSAADAQEGNKSPSSCSP